jgi:hypothetical protein
MREGRVLAALLGLPALLGAVTALILVGRSDATPGGGEPLTLGSAVVGDGQVSVLNHRGSSEDALSTRTLDVQAARSVLSGAGDARLAKAVGAVRVFVAPGKRSSDICLIVEDASEQSTAIDCAARSVLTKGTIYMTKPGSETQTVDVFALVSDGVTSVGSAKVENNVAVIHNLTGQVIALKNDAGQVSTVDLGRQFLP